MTDSDYVVTCCSASDAEGLERGFSGLPSYNDAHAGPPGFGKVQLLLRTASGVLRGGLTGKHAGGVRFRSVGATTDKRMPRRAEPRTIGGHRLTKGPPAAVACGGLRPNRPQDEMDVRTR
jgi:hypothetical protein